MKDGRVSVDAVCDRIQWLVENRLVRIAESPDGWDTLFLDPSDGRHWKRSYPKSAQQGGGPPSLLLASPEQFDAAPANADRT